MNIEEMDELCASKSRDITKLLICLNTILTLAVIAGDQQDTVKRIESCLESLEHKKIPTS